LTRAVEVGEDDVVTQDRSDLTEESLASLGDGASNYVPRRRPPGEARSTPGEDLRAEGRAICCEARGALSAKYSAVVDTTQWRRRSRQ